LGSVAGEGGLKHWMATVKGGDKVVVHQRLGQTLALGQPDPDMIDVVPGPPKERQPLAPPSEPPTVLSRRQKVVFSVVGAALLGGLVLAPVPTSVAVLAILVVFFMAANVMKLVLISQALNHPHQVTVDVTGDRVPDDDLPVYTILLPVYREADMLTQLVDGILSLDYPASRLDVKLLLEEDDTETRQAAADLDLPACFDVLVVRGQGPTGKPRACNHGLAHARGEYLVIYDAEDRPEADQLRKSVLAFAEADPEVVCLQAQLNYFNRTYNLLTRWFTAEYSVWFDQLLPGLQAMDAVIPLGGTSNHFVTERLVEIGGWNSFNVTEDADLGLRIFLKGWKTAILETTTYEEATSRYRNWVRQRSRWVKGYMQTYLFHMRRPVQLAREMGLKSFTAFQLFFGAGTLCLLLNPLFWLLAVLWFATKLHFIQSVFPWPVLYLGTVGLFVGNAACVLSVVSGCFGRRNYEDVKYALLVPVYWILMSVGAWKALLQLFTKPTYWEKTEHGFCRFEDPGEVPEAPIRSAPASLPSAS
jgi:cellulose synthase/poly-beta-1,6-N-acetylglucosamine synthase-like glycosyltransferase